MPRGLLHARSSRMMTWLADVSAEVGLAARASVRRTAFGAVTVTATVAVAASRGATRFVAALARVMNAETRRANRPDGVSAPARRLLAAFASTPVGRRDPA